MICFAALVPLCGSTLQEVCLFQAADNAGSISPQHERIDRDEIDVGLYYVAYLRAGFGSAWTNGAFSGLGQGVLSTARGERLGLGRIIDRFAFVDNQVFARLNTYELHFAGPRRRERTDQKIAEDCNVLINLAGNRRRNISVTGYREALLRNSKHPSRTDLPEPQRGRSVINRQAPTHTETTIDQLRMSAT